MVNPLDKGWHAEDHVLRSVYLPKSMDDQLKEYAEEHKMSVSEAMNHLIYEATLEMRGDKHRLLHPRDLYRDMDKFLELGKINGN